MTIPLPLYWKNEESGAMADIVQKHLAGEQLTNEQINAFRWYLRQFVESGAFVKGPEVRLALSRLQWARTNAEFGLVIDLLVHGGIDPL